MTDDKKAEHKQEEAQKRGERLSEEAAEKGYVYDSLTPDQKAALDAEEEFRKDSEKFQESDDPDDFNEQRQQV